MRAVNIYWGEGVVSSKGGAAGGDPKVRRPGESKEGFEWLVKQLVPF